MHTHSFPTPPAPLPQCAIFCGTSFLLARQALCAAANLTTNELLLRSRCARAAVVRPFVPCLSTNNLFKRCSCLYSAFGMCIPFYALFLIFTLARHPVCVAGTAICRQPTAPSATRLTRDPWPTVPRWAAACVWLSSRGQWVCGRQRCPLGMLRLARLAAATTAAVAVWGAPGGLAPGTLPLVSSASMHAAFCVITTCFAVLERGTARLVLPLRAAAATPAPRQQRKHISRGGERRRRQGPPAAQRLAAPRHQRDIAATPLGHRT